MQNETIRPLYDLYEGLGRRRRLERIGLDPNKAVKAQKSGEPGRVAAETQNEVCVD